MHMQSLVGAALAGATIVSAGRVPMTVLSQHNETSFGGKNGTALGKNETSFDNPDMSEIDKLYIPQLPIADLPQLSTGDQEVLTKLFKAVKGLDKISSFKKMKLPVTAKEASDLSKKLGKNGLGRVAKTPGQPVTIVVSFLRGIFECGLAGKPLHDAVECGRDKVRELGDNRVVEVPERCNNLLGQFEIPFTGWPAPCHDPGVKQHPEGNAARRWLLRSMCKAFTSLAGSKFAEADRERGKPSCDERFPSDGQIAQLEADAQTKAKLEEARDNLVAHRQQVQDKVNNGGQVEQADIDRAAELIADGAFPSAQGQDKEEASKMAKWYLEDVKPSSSGSDGGENTGGSGETPTPEAGKPEDGGKDLPSWATASQVTAADLPKDDEATKEAFDLADGSGPYRGLFQKDVAVDDDKKCYNEAGLAAAEPGEDWDRISAVLSFLDQKMREKKRVCKACEAQDGQWALRCGSTAA